MAEDEGITALICQDTQLLEVAYILEDLGSTDAVKPWEDALDHLDYLKRIMRS